MFFVNGMRRYIRNSSVYTDCMWKTNIHKSGQAFYNLKKSGLVTQPIPLPPIEEQQRILEKLDQLLPLCEQLEKMTAYNYTQTYMK